MSRSASHGIVTPRGLRNRLLRILLFAILGLFVIYYLVPLFVMVATSLKSLEEIRSGSLLSWPASNAPSIGSTQGWRTPVRCWRRLLQHQRPC